MPISLLFAAVVAVAGFAIPTAQAASVPIVKTFSAVTVHFSTANPEAGTLANGYCKGKGFAHASSYVIGVIQGSPFSNNGRAFFPSISCLRKVS